MFKQLSENALEDFLDHADSDFVANIDRMHEMYNLPITNQPSLHNLTKPNGLVEAASARIKGFLRTLNDEIDEGHEIHECLVVLEDPNAATPVGLSPESQGKIEAIRTLIQEGNADEAEKIILVMIADWLADMVVYIRSEAMKFGIPLEMVQHIVMASNFTKLPSDGVPKHDDNGKFLKDMTNYQPPEDAIYSVIFDSEIYDVEDDIDEDDE